MFCEKQGNQSRCRPLSDDGGSQADGATTSDGGTTQRTDSGAASTADVINAGDASGTVDTMTTIQPDASAESRLDGVGGLDAVVPPPDLPAGMCPAGYAGTPPNCTDIDECATMNGGCSPNATCRNTPGSRTCTCQAGFKGNGLTCQGDEATLKSLTTSAGTLTPPFSSDTVNYTVSLPTRTPTVTVTATATKTSGTTIAINGNSVESGTPSSPLDMALGPNVVKIDVKAESGTVQTYTIVLQRTLRADGQVKSTPPFDDASFGHSIAVSGQYVAVGAPRELEFTGAVYIFRRESGSWIQTAAVKAPNSEKSDSFGTSVSLAGDVLVVGASTESSEVKGVFAGPPGDTNAASFSGAVYVFRRSGETWPLEAYFKASDASSSSQFGSAVSVSGEYVAVGASQKAGPAAQSEAGALYLFRRTGSTWSQTAGPIYASDPSASAAFGSTIALTGETVAVGAPGRSPGGAVHVLRKASGSESWSPLGSTITLGNPGPLDAFGKALAWISADMIAIGAPNRDDMGAVHVFKLSGSAWQPQGSMIRASETAGGDDFGEAVAAAGDILAVGAPGRSSHGAAYVFRRVGGVWMQDGTALRPPGLMADDRFGNAVGLGLDTLAIGAPGDDAPTSSTNNTAFFYAW